MRLMQAGVVPSVSEVAEAAGQFGHLCAEAADDHGRRRRGSQETIRTAGRARPHLTQRGDRRLHRGPPRDVTVDGAPERCLLCGIWCAGAASGTDSKE